MKSYSTFASRMFVLRKEGYYPSDITAARVVARMAVVHQWTEIEQRSASFTLAHGLPSAEAAREWYGRNRGFTNPYDVFSGNDLDVLRNFIAWYSIDEDTADRRAFVTVDLNTGFSLVIAER